MTKTKQPPELPEEKTYLYFAVLVWMVIFIFIGLNTRSILQNKKVYIESATIESKTKAQLLGENTSNTLYSIDLTLSSILRQIKIIDLPLDTEHIAPIIREAAVFLPQVDTIFLLSDDNRQIYPRAPEQSLSPSCLEDHRTAWIDFCISTRSEMNGNKQIIISRRIESKQGAFMGVIAAIIDPSFISDRHKNYLDLDIQDVALLDAEKQILTSWHDMTAKEHKNNKTQPEHFVSNLPIETIKSGGLKTIETHDAIISVYQLQGFPFQIVVAQEKQHILQAWNRHKNYLITVGIITVFFGITAMFIITSQRSKKRKAQNELIQHQQTLEETISERTLNMQRANTKLRSEIEERLQVESKLRESEQSYKQIYDSISDCVIISDLKGWIIDANPAACNAYGYSKQELIGSHFTRIVHKDYHSQFEQYGKDLVSIGQYFGEVVAVRKDGGLINTIVKGNLYISRGQQRVLGVIRDVTREKHNEQQREELISKLQNALEEIKSLEGIVPICAHCKKIRDDKGYWNLLETYIEKHSDASFSHGICPECSDALYGKQEWYIKMKEKKASDASQN